jgi:hypothetical protein
MKWIASIVALFTALVSAQAPATKSAAAPAKRPTKQYTMEQFPDTTSIQGGYFTADESKVLFSSNKTGIWNAYTVPAVSPASASRRAKRSYHSRSAVIDRRTTSTRWTSRRRN